MRRPLRPIAALLSLACACAPGGPREPDPWPTVAWARSTPEAQGVDSSRLATLVERVRERDLDLHSLLLVRHGVIVLDATFFPYDGARPHDVASCTKSLTATAVGLALTDGELASLQTPLVELLPGYPLADARARDVTVEHALTMTAGFACVTAPTEVTLLEMQAADDWIGFALGLPMSDAPGASWRYCSSASHLLSGAVTAAVDAPLDRYLRDRLLAPIGAGASIWPRDPQGRAHGWGDARLYPEDLARVGLLYLHGGRWDDAQRLDAAFVDAATRDEVLAGGPEGGYGYQWWIDEGGSFHASGRGGQFLYVAPALDLIVVATGGADEAQLEVYDQLLAEELLPAIVDDDPLPEDAAANAQLAALLEAVRLPPAPRSPAPAPALAEDVAARRYALADNLFGWEALRLTTGEVEAILEVEVDGASERLTVGLDGVPRITRGVRFASGARLDDVDVALVGDWVDERFTLSFDTIDRIDAGALT
ncbi:MAG: serine hydrolase, partial [Myxococcales bacterium]|nr:serine hydrolase [Myxococcales bacterium]